MRIYSLFFSIFDQISVTDIKSLSEELVLFHSHELILFHWQQSQNCKATLKSGKQAGENETKVYRESNSAKRTEENRTA